MNVGKAILRVLRVFGIIILIPVVLVLLVLLIGFITDLSVTPQWKQAQQESQDYFSKIKTQHYSSGVSFAILDANAWDYYDRAVKKTSAGLSAGNLSIATLTKEGEPFDIKLAERLTQTSAPALALLDSGAACTYCAIPYEYEKGMTMPIPNYIGLQNLAKLGVIRGRLEMTRGKPRAAAESYARVMKMGADIGGGGEALIGRMVGIVIGQIALKQIAADLAQFDLPSILSLENTISQLESDWPSPNTSLECEIQVYFLPGLSGWNGSSQYFTALSQRVPRPGLVGKIQAQGVLSALSWRSFFSCRKGLLDGLRPNIAFAHQARTLQGKSWEEGKAWLEQLSAEWKRAAQRRDPAFFILPNISRMSKRFYQYLNAMRVLKAALALRKNHGVPRKEPEFLPSLEGFHDRANGQPLHLIPAPSGKGIRLYSVGLNLKDDGGEGSPKPLGWVQDQDKDDIWIDVP